MTQKARQIGKAKLLQLVKAAEACTSRMGEERQALGAKFEAAATSDNFDAKALRPLLPLLKMEAGPQAHRWRTMCLYAEHLGIGAQGDLEDVIRNSEAGDEDGGEGGEGGDGDDGADEAENDPVDQVLAGIVSPELGRFRTSIAGATAPEAVNKGLERFTEDHPDQADEALAIATERLEAIAAEQSGGEDLRPDALRDAAKVEAGQVADIAKERAKRPRKPRSPAAEAAQANGIGGDPFGQATKH
jgi:hypothetical protein